MDESIDRFLISMVITVRGGTVKPTDISTHVVIEPMYFGTDPPSVGWDVNRSRKHPQRTRTYGLEFEPILEESEQLLLRELHEKISVRILRESLEYGRVRRER